MPKYNNLFNYNPNALAAPNLTKMGVTQGTDGSYRIGPIFSSPENFLSPIPFWGQSADVSQFGLPQTMSDGTITPNNMGYSGQKYNGWKPFEAEEAPMNDVSGEEDPGSRPVDPYNGVAANQNLSLIGMGTNNMNYFASRLGEFVGNAKSGRGGAGNTATGVMAGLGLASSLFGKGMELFRTGSASSAATQRNNWIAREAARKQREAQQGQTTYAAKGGVVSNNETRIVPITGASGEFIAPKKGESNVVVEQGESIKIPGDDVVKEALGDRHEDGGTPTELPQGSEILSDRLKLTDEQAAMIRDRYSLKVSPKMTYAEAQSKYKQKIGLSEKLDEMQKLTDKLSKNNKEIRDKNTARLNESVLSKRMEEVQKEIDVLSSEDSSFFDVLFSMQQDEKKKEIRQRYFGEGGIVDRDKFNESLKKFGYTEEQGIEMIVDRVMKGEYAEGGRYMEFVPVYNRFRTENETYGDKGYQALINGTYGKVSEWGEEAIKEMATLFPELTRGKSKIINVSDGKYSWANPGNMAANAKTIEQVVNGAYSGLEAISGIIPNYNDIRNSDIQKRWTPLYGFSNKTEVGPVPPSSSEYAHNERTGEGKLGEYHMSRSLGGLRVVDPIQLKKLNDAGIRNYTDLVVNEAKGKEILGDDYASLVKMREREGASGLDFVLMSYDPASRPLAPLEAPGIPKPSLQIPTGPGQKPITTAVKVEEREKEEPESREQAPRRGNYGSALPWLFNPDMGLPAPSTEDPVALQQVRMMHAEPVLRSADQTVAAINQNTNAQLFSLNDLADASRMATTAFIGAKADEAAARAIGEIDIFNAEQRNRASELNEQRYMQTEQINAALRQNYEDRVLQGRAAGEDAWFRYYQNLRDQHLSEKETAIKAQILSNIYPDTNIFGEYTGTSALSVGPNVAAERARREEEYEEGKKRKGSSSSSSTTAKKKK